MHKRIKEWLEAACYAAVVIFILYFICWPYKVSGDSMGSSFLPKDRVVVSRLLLYANQIHSGDIVVGVVRKGQSEGQATTILKRVIGVPGDHVFISHGKVFVNENELLEPYLGNTTTIGDVDVSLQEEEYFLLGDNRETSIDSRHFGLIKRGELTGKVIFKWFPIKSMKRY